MLSNQNIYSHKELIFILSLFCRKSSGIVRKINSTGLKLRMNTVHEPLELALLPKNSVKNQTTFLFFETFHSEN